MPRIRELYRTRHPSPTEPTAPRPGPNAALPDADLFVPSGPPRAGADTLLGTFAGQPVVVTTDGRFGIGTAPKDLAEEIRALRIATTGAPGFQPLSEVSSPAQLRAIASHAARLFQACLRPSDDPADALLLRQGRAAALAMMEAAARRAHQLGDADAKDALSLALVQSIAQEPFRPLRDFFYDSALTRAQAGELTPLTGVEELLYPSKPSYAQWLRDGKIQFVYYTDDDGSPRAGNVRLFEQLGSQRTENPDGSTTMILPERGDEPRIEVVIQPAPKPGTVPSLFEHANRPDVDVIAYSGHAGYGRRVDKALAGTEASGADGKLILLMQCYGEGNIESIKRAHPGALILSTRAASYDHCDFALVRNLVGALRHKEGWAPVRERTLQDVLRMGLSEEEARNQYFYPDDRKVLLGKSDRDNDGIRDLDDSVFNVVARLGRVDAAGGLDPLESGVELESLDGSSLTRAAVSLNLVARYSQLPPECTRGVPWNAEVFQPAGFFQPGEGDLSAFRFQANPAKGAIEVRLSSAFAHTSPQTLARMLAYEGGLWVGQQTGLNGAESEALALTLLERILAQEGPAVALSTRDNLEEPLFQERLFRKRYQLPITFKDLKATIGSPHHLDPSHYRAVLARVRADETLTAAATARPVRATRPLEIPEELRLPTPLDEATVRRLLPALKLPAEWGEVSWVHLPKALPGRIHVQLQNEGARSLVVLGADREGYIRAASRIEA